MIKDESLSSLSSMLKNWLKTEKKIGLPINLQWRFQYFMVQCKSFEEYSYINYKINSI